MDMDTWVVETLCECTRFSLLSMYLAFANESQLNSIQYVRLLDLRHVVNPILSNNETVYKVLCRRYLEDGAEVCKPVERGRFETFDRDLLPDVDHA